MKAISLRLEESQYDALKVVADAEAVALSKAIRDAIDDYIDKRSADPDFQARLQAAEDRHTAALRVLKGRPTSGQRSRR
jgi:predicted DNA-binding ribbon-helix-helix protein